MKHFADYPSRTQDNFAQITEDERLDGEEHQKYFLVHDTYIIGIDGNVVKFIKIC